MTTPRENLTRPVCPVCHSSGKNRFVDVVDLYFSVEGSWNIRQCDNRHCGLWWLDPMPPPDAIAETYNGYFTHTGAGEGDGMGRYLEHAILDGHLGYRSGVGPIARFVGRVLGMLPPARDEAARRVMWLTASMRGRLLDVGCGNGAFLARMRNLGWDVQGVEPDARAADVARRHHALSVFHGTLDAFEEPGESYDGITLNHVVEHVPNPIALLQTSERLLKSGGRLVIATPNVLSLGERVFGSSWRGLEVPRHLCLFSPKSLAHLLTFTDLRVELLRTPARSARWMWSTSSSALARDKPATGRSKQFQRVLPWLFQFIEQTATLFTPVGEEILLVAIKD